MADEFASYASGLESPAFDAEAVTPSDGADLTTVARGLYIGGSGDISLTTAGGTTLTFSAVPSGSILPVRTARIRATGTTATNIVALW